MHFLARSSYYQLAPARSFTIIAFTKSVLHNPVWNRFYSEDSERIVRAEIFIHFILTSPETAMSIRPIMFTFNLQSY